MTSSTNDAAELPMDDQHRLYDVLAEAALQQYALGPTTPVFIEHNAGIVFRVDAPAMGRSYLLKLYERVGIGSNPSAAQLEAGSQWLTAFAHASDVVVQIPVRTKTGQFVAQVASSSTPTPINCTVQHWIAGDLPNGDFTPHQAQQIGVLLAKLHAFSRTYASTHALPAMRHDANALVTNVQTLRAALDRTQLPADAFAILIAAQDQIINMMTELGTEPAMWGPVHGDLHYDNLLFYHDEVRPIDFTGLRVAHYMYDLGVTVYHTFHQGPAIRRALFAGYEQILPLPDDYQRYVEAFVTYAAIDNVAWNSTIPTQVEAPLFRRNLHSLVHTYCAAVANNQRFLFS